MGTAGGDGVQRDERASLDRRVRRMAAEGTGKNKPTRPNVECEPWAGQGDEAELGVRTVGRDGEQPHTESASLGVTAQYRDDRRQ